MPGRWLDGDDVGGSPRERARVAADRASKACNECKSRHDKCDGVKPVCSRCTGRGLMCSYVRPTKIAGPRRGWVDDFKARIEAAERSVHRLSTLIAKSKSGIFSPRHEFSDQATLLRTHGSPRDCIDAALRNIEQMVTDMCNDLEGAAGITDSASPTTRYCDNGKTEWCDLDQVSKTSGGDTAIRIATPTSLLEQPLYPIAQQGVLDDNFFATLDDASFSLTPSRSSLSLPETGYPIPHQLSIFDDLPVLASPDDVNGLVQAYYGHVWDFRFIKVGFPKLRRSRLFAGDSLQDTLLLYAMLAFTSSFSDVGSYQTQKSNCATFFARCMRLLPVCLDVADASLSVVQALNLMTHYTCASGDSDLSDPLHALAVLKAREFGIFSPPPYESSTSTTTGEIESEARTMTAWWIYTTDRIISVGANKTAVLTDSEVTVAFPSDSVAWSELDGEPIFGDVEYSEHSPIELYRIMGEAQTLKRQSGEFASPRLLGDLAKWHASFLAAHPAATRTTSALPPLESAAAQGLLLFHATAIIVCVPPHFGGAPGNQVGTSTDAMVLSHATEAMEVVRMFLGKGTFWSPTMLFCIYLCAKVLVQSFTGNPDQPVPSDVDIALLELSYYVGKWGVIVRYVEDLLRQKELALSQFNHLVGVQEAQSHANGPHVSFI